MPILQKILSKKPEEQKVELSRDIKIVRTPEVQSSTSNEKKDLKVPESSNYFDTVLVNPVLDEEIQNESEEEITVVNTQSQILERIVEGNDARKGRGRRQKILNGGSGPPRKEYHILEEQTGLAEIPVRSEMESPVFKEWIEVMAEKFVSIIKNDTCDMVDRPTNQRIIGSRVVFRIKHGPDGKVSKRKARVVAKEFSQRRLVITVAVQHNMEIRQFDVVTAYLNGFICEEIYVEAPEYTEKVLRFVADK